MRKKHAGNADWNAVEHPAAPEGLSTAEGEKLFTRVIVWLHRMRDRGLRPQYLEVTHAQAVALLVFLKYPPRTFGTYLNDIKLGTFQWGQLYVAFGPLLRLSAPRPAPTHSKDSTCQKRNPRPQHLSA